MPPKEPQTEPFLTRRMLDFEHGAAIQLQLEMVTVVAAEIQINGITKSEAFGFQTTGGGAGALETETFGLTDIPIAISVHTTSAAVEYGEFWAAIHILINGERVMTLCQGYISRQSGIAYPRVQSDSEIGQAGKLELITVADPAAGANFSQAVPTGERWKLIYCRFKLVTSATVATRQVRLQVAPDAGSFPIAFLNEETQTASVTNTYNFSNFGSRISGPNASMTYPLIPANIEIPAAGTIATSINNIQAGDQLSEIRIYIKKFLEI